MKVLDRLALWRERHRAAAHQRWLKKNRVVKTSPDPKCVVRNFREPI